MWSTSADLSIFSCVTATSVPATSVPLKSETYTVPNPPSPSWFPKCIDEAGIKHAPELDHTVKY